jgi:PAS domain-containing protein
VPEPTHQLLTAVADGITDAFAFKDTEGRYLMLNEPGARMLGGHVDEIIGRTDLEVLGEEAAAPIRAADRAVLESNWTVTWEIPV